MLTTLSIKQVPSDLAEQLKARAAANHRSLQGEVMAILEAAVKPENGFTRGSITPLQLMQQVAEYNIHSASESAQITRDMRDGRNAD